VDSTKAKLSQLVTGPGHVFHYTYDFGDDWMHLIEVDVGVPADPGWIPHLIDGASPTSDPRNSAALDLSWGDPVAWPFIQRTVLHGLR
jgi:hypothetical protein